MKRMIYLFLCILTCAAFITACGKKNTESGDVPADQKISDFNNDLDSEEDPEIPDEDVINPAAEDEPGDEDLKSENYDDTDNYDEVPVGDASDDLNDSNDEVDDNDDVDNSTTDAQNNVSENPSKEFTGSGTFNGFVDSTSIEVTMADGTFQTFFVYDEGVISKLEKLDTSGDSPTIKFTYRGKDGQINPEIIALH